MYSILSFKSLNATLILYTVTIAYWINCVDMDINAIKIKQADTKQTKTHFQWLDSIYVVILSYTLKITASFRNSRHSTKLKAARYGTWHKRVARTANKTFQFNRIVDIVFCSSRGIVKCRVLCLLYRGARIVMCQMRGYLLARHWK